MCDCFPWATMASTRVPDSVMEIVIKAICAENFSVHLNHHRDIAPRDVTTQVGITLMPPIR